MSLIQSLSDRKHQSSVWDYFKYEKDLNKSRSIVDEKEKRYVKRYLWTIKSFKPLKFELKLELKLELK